MVKRRWVKLEENVDNLFMIWGLGKDFQNWTPKTPIIKNRINKLDYIKTKNFCSPEDTNKG